MAPCEPQEQTAWPERLKGEFRDVEIGIARTRAEWKGVSEVREVEALYVEHIRRAKKFIYAESQYFASRAVAEAVAERMAEPDPPEFVLINPETAEGWLEQAAMDGARVELARAIGERDHARRFRIYIPLTKDGEAIYIHSKTMIIDDEVVRVGSSNMNNRSMGLDTEADVFIDAARPGNAHAGKVIYGLRCVLLAEHLGVDIAVVEQGLAEHGSMIRLLDETERGDKRLEPFVPHELSDTAKTVADSALLDPERPEELFEPIARRRGLFHGHLHLPGKWRANV